MLIITTNVILLVALEEKSGDQNLVQLHHIYVEMFHCVSQHFERLENFMADSQDISLSQQNNSFLNIEYTVFIIIVLKDLLAVKHFVMVWPTSLWAHSFHISTSAIV